MKIFKLGCNWGKGKPSFYKLIRDKNFVIGLSDKRYSIGDLVLATEGFTAKSIIKIISQPVAVTSMPELKDAFVKNKIDYEDWVEIYQGTFYDLNVHEQFKYKLQQGIVQVQQDEIKSKVISMLKQKEGIMKLEEYSNLLETNKNIILTGAPGTGKTYLAKEIAKQMIGAKTDEELEESGQFGFVQFHPSYDYTDFVEGLRPTQPDENGTIGFELKDGIFKSFCQKALNSKFSKADDNFDEVWENLLTAVRDNLAQGKLTKIGSWEYGLSSKDSLKYSSVNTPSQYSFTIAKKNIYDAYQGKQARPSGGFQKDIEDVVDYLKEHFGLEESVNNQENSNEGGNKNYVFVIDEINRGEISKIFGELFFSIDPSYRGKKGTVKTQYSNLHNDENKIFYVPENVYIIGTMNDIDRSVESFDFAMRRRFTWIEITAEESAENINLPHDIKERMLKLNKQISATDGLNYSYHIGAAYFLDSNGKVMQDIDAIWNLRIEPLLKEYLRGIPDSIEKIDDFKIAFFS